jgi:hypothetical protein
MAIHIQQREFIVLIGRASRLAWRPTLGLDSYGAA